MDIRKLAVAETAFMHLRSADGDLLFEGDKPVGITLFGPGSKTYARAVAARTARLTERLKKGRADITADETSVENSTFLVACTKSFENIEFEGLEGEALFRGVYAAGELGFIAEQAGKFIGEWSNFGSQPSRQA